MAELALPAGKSGARQLGKLPVRVDLTAMVDLAFLLITFFILTTTLMKNKSLELTQPVPDAHPQAWAASRTLSICIGKTGQAVCYLGTTGHPIIAPETIAFGKDMDKMLLETGKKVQASTGKSLIVIIKPSDHALYSHIVSTLDELNITRTSSYAIGPISKQDIDLLKEKKVY
jgi:biopolymer transport protein ExbD